MKSLKYLSILSLFVAVVIVGCYKDSEWSGNPANQGTGSYLRFMDVATKPSFDLDSAAAATTTLSCRFERYGEAIQTVNVYVVAGSTNTVANWKLIKTLPGADQMTITVTGADLMKALGVTTLRKGALYTIYNEVIDVKGRKFNMANVNASFEAPDPYASPMTYRAAFRWKPQTAIK